MNVDPSAPELVSVIVPCRNERRDIENSVRSILQQVLHGYRLEVLIADGCSDDGTREILDRMAAENPGRVHVVENPGRIVSTGLNAAIRAARGDYVVRMDAHTIYAPDYIARCLEVLESSGADNVGGPWVARGKGYWGVAIAAAFQSPFSAGGARGHDPSYEGPVDTVYLGCWKRTAFDRFGGFDEELVRNQDDEHNLRIHRGGGRVWQSPRIRSWYVPRGSLRALFRQYSQYGYWKVRVIQKHRLPASMRHVVPAGAILGLGLMLLLGFFWSAVWFVAAVSVLGYAAASILASVHCAFRSSLRYMPVLPFVFACFHWGYGLGFLRGVVDFVWLRRGAATSFTQLTRK